MCKKLDYSIFQIIVSFFFKIVWTVLQSCFWSTLNQTVVCEMWWMFAKVTFTVHLYFSLPKKFGWPLGLVTTFLIVWLFVFVPCPICILFSHVSTFRDLSKWKAQFYFEKRILIKCSAYKLLQKILQILTNLPRYQRLMSDYSFRVQKLNFHALQFY